MYIKGGRFITDGIVMSLRIYFFSIFRLIHGGQLLNGLAGPTLMSAGPLLSTTWFAPDQRATATAVASLVGYLGAACSFLIGPLAVPAPNDTQIVNSITQWDPGHIRDRIQFVLYTGTVLAPFEYTNPLFCLGKQFHS